MKTKVSPAVIGAFVIGAFALGIVALLTFGGVNFFDKPQRFLVHFDESIHGLDQGSPVKLRGVRVGRVAALTVRYDEAKNRSIAAVICELNRDAVSKDGGGPINISDRAELQMLVDRGLRARLEVQSLATGLLFVGLDFFDPKEYPDPGVQDARYPVVPAVPSAISEISGSATDILASLQKVDFAALSRSLQALIGDGRKQLEGLDLKGTVEQWKKTGAQIEALAANPQFVRTLENLDGAVTELRATIAKLNAQVEPTTTELKATLAEAQRTIESFHATAVEARKFIAAQAGIGGELAETLEHLNAAADSVRQLADFLERNPNALLTGKKRPE